MQPNDRIYIPHPRAPRHSSPFFMLGAVMIALLAALLVGVIVWFVRS
jgi:hypothetical protein